MGKALNPISQLREQVQAQYLKSLEALNVLEEFLRRTGNGSPLRAIKGDRHAFRGERLGQLSQFLKHNGPARFNAIVEGTGIPTGTLPGLLKKHPELFKKEGRLWKALGNRGL